MSRLMHTHAAWDYQIENPIAEKYKPTLCGVTRVERNIDNDNPTCKLCFDELFQETDRLPDDRLFQMWLNEYDKAYRYMLGHGIRPERAGYITHMCMPSYCKWLGHRLYDLRE